MWRKLASREGVDITTISQIDLVFYEMIWDYTQTKDEQLFTFVKGKNFTHYIASDFTEVGRSVYKKYFNNPKQIIDYYKKGKILKKKIQEDSKKWLKIVAKNPNSENLLSAFHEFKISFEEVCNIYSIISFIGIEAWQSDFEKTLQGIIARHHQELKAKKIIASVYHPWKKTALIEIQEKLAKGVNPDQLVKDYQFLRSWSVVWFRPLAKEWIQGIKTNLSENAHFSKKEITKMLQPTAEEMKILKLAPYMVFFKDWRDDVRRYHAFQWSFLFDQLSTFLSIPRDDLGYLSMHEIERAILTGKIDHLLITRRKEGCIVTLKEGPFSMHVISHIPQKYAEIMEGIEKGEKEQTIKGRVAQPGVVTGIVKIIRSYHDIKRIKEGDILVANTTHPNYLPAMQIAAAFVTNEGGMISHAAIVAREMKKPCIVGTGNATKILIEGDTVEVNATKGIVTILKRQAA